MHCARAVEDRLLALSPRPGGSAPRPIDWHATLKIQAIVPQPDVDASARAWDSKTASVCARGAQAPENPCHFERTPAPRHKDEASTSGPPGVVDGRALRFPLLDEKVLPTGKMDMLGIRATADTEFKPCARISKTFEGRSRRALGAAKDGLDANPTSTKSK